MNTRAANRYAKALLSLALDQKQEGAIFSNMQDIATSIEQSKDLQILLDNPVIKNSVKKDALEKIFNQLSPLSKKLIELLEENKRMSLLQAIALQYIALYNKNKGIVKATVTTAVSIDEDLKKEVLKKAIEMANGKKIALDNKIDEAILGGFILRVGDTQIDASIANKLKKLKRDFKEKIYLS